MTLRRTFIILTGLLFTVFVFVCSVLYTNRVIHQDDWKKRTTPLPKETIDMLCLRFERSLEDPLCNGDKDVYVLDFVNVMQDTFRPYETYEIESSEAATYNEVEEKIGEFKYECESVTHQTDGLSYFVCYYDLRGDKKFTVAIVYSHPEMAVMRLGSASRFYDY